MVPANTLAFVGGVPGGTELVVILLIAVLLFGANKIPKLARSTGQAMGEFQRGREEIEQELEEIKDTASVDTDLETSPGSTGTPGSTATQEPSGSEQTETETDTSAESADSSESTSQN